MPKISSFFHGSSSTQHYDATVQNHESGKTVHDTVRPDKLGLHNYQGKTVTVSSGTLNALADATWANRVAKSVIASGSGNQRTDIIESGGESWARLHLANQKYPAGGSAAQLKRAQKFQGGNCSIHASIAIAALQSRGVDAPINRVRMKLPDGNSHEFVLLGDPRVPKYGEKNTVVVDPWPSYPSACTLDQAILHDATRNTHAPITQLMNDYRHEIYHASVSPQDAQRLTKIEVLGTAALEKKLEKMKLPPLGSQELINHALADNRYGQFDVRVATDPSTGYRDESGAIVRTFDPLLR
ncbi:hypothetical protein [Pseudomonas cichorii]|uniref:hypothetical protein n=1 Tax=Pseudomonas cichorii TaxID=36746 RepID=UPI001C891FC9|nr:hypothetical protein [Pseudomonas cichorii]MBX8493756.1 hypothetical protein [Pseudomonas cichorii]MBX8513241.1 hypothetical protein [Pseudomonas cichorii]MBX8528675.1 hypothetical protein [Pseudomonas cichorii]